MVYVYSFGRLFWQGFFAALWLGVGSAYLVLEPDWRRSVICFVIGAFYLLTLLYEWWFKYFELSNDGITLYALPKQHIRFEALIDVAATNKEVVFRSRDNVIRIKRSRVLASQRQAFDAEVVRLQGQRRPVEV